MGVQVNVGYDRFPGQGDWVGRRVSVCFNLDTSRRIPGVLVRDDRDAPYMTIIRLEDGRHVLGTECQYTLLLSTDLQALTARPDSAADAVEMRFDREEARGVVQLKRGTYGPTLVVNGIELGYVDLFPAKGREPMQLLLFDPKSEDEPVAKAFMEAGRLVVLVSGDADTFQTENTIHQGVRDHAYALPVPEGVPE